MRIERNWIILFISQKWIMYYIRILLCIALFRNFFKNNCSRKFLALENYDLKSNLTYKIQF